MTSIHAGTSQDSTMQWSVIVHYRWIAIGVAIIISLLAVFYAIVATPVYRVSVTMVSNLQDDSFKLASLSRQVGGLASLAGLDVASEGDPRQAAIATLRSRALAEEFISENNLLPILFEDRWDAAANTWILDDDEDPPSLRDGFRKFNKEVRFVEEDYTTGLIRLVIEWKDPALAAEWANAIVDKVNERLRADAILQARNNLEYLRNELSGTTILEIRNAIFGLIEDQVHKAMMANVHKSFAFRVIDPAVVPDDEEYVRPDRILIVSLGFLLAPLFGMLVALICGFVAGLRRLAGNNAAGQDV